MLKTWHTKAMSTIKTIEAMTQRKTLDEFLYALKAHDLIVMNMTRTFNTVVESCYYMLTDDAGTLWTFTSISDTHFGLVSYKANMHDITVMLAWDPILVGKTRMELSSLLLKCSIEPSEFSMAYTLMGNMGKALQRCLRQTDEQKLDNLDIGSILELY